MKKIVILLFSCLLTLSVAAVTQVGQWYAHLSYNNTSKVVVTPNKVFAIADGHVYSMQKQSKAVETYTKIEGWSDNKVADLAYNEQAEVLVCAYSNANIDLVSLDGSVYNIPDLLQKNWSVDKTIYQIYNEGKYAYLACGFGVLVLDLEKKEVKDTYIIGPDAQKVPVYGFTADDSYFYALSTEVIYRAQKTTPNLLDYNAWQEHPISLPLGGAFEGLFTTASGLLTVQEKTKVYHYNQAQWLPLHEGEVGKTSVNVSEGRVLLSAGNQGVLVYNNQLELEKSYNVIALHAAFDAANLWYAYTDYGLACMDTLTNEMIVRRPSYLRSSTMKELTIEQGRLMVAPGGYWIDRFGNPCLISRYEGNNWHTYSSQTLQADKWVENLRDVTSIAIDPANLEHFYFTSFGEGLFEVTDGVITQMYNETNSNGWVTSAITGDDHYVRLDGLAYDKKGNLWFLNSYSSVNVLTPQGEKFKLPYASRTVICRVRRCRRCVTRIW